MDFRQVRSVTLECPLGFPFHGRCRLETSKHTTKHGVVPHNPLGPLRARGGHAQTSRHKQTWQANAHITDLLHQHGLVQASAPAALHGYEIYNTTWVASVRPGGETVELNGTIQQVRAQLLELNPNYNADYNIDVERIHQGWSMFCINAGCTPATAAETTTRLLQDDSVLTFRGFVQTKCLNHDSLARMTAIDEGVRHLRDLKTHIKPKNGPGPNNCGRVSCSWAAGIYWCNDVCFSLLSLS